MVKYGPSKLQAQRGPGACCRVGRALQDVMAWARRQRVEGRSTARRVTDRDADIHLDGAVGAAAGQSADQCAVRVGSTAPAED